MSAARLTGNADPIGIDLEIAGARPHPAGRIIDVDQRGRIAVGRMAEVQRGNDKAVSRQGFVETLGAGQVAAGPRATMEVDDRRERAVALGLVEPRYQPRVAVAEILDIFGREFMSVIRHIHSLPGLLCCGALRIGTPIVPGSQGRPRTLLVPDKPGKTAGSIECQIGRRG